MNGTGRAHHCHVRGVGRSRSGSRKCKVALYQPSSLRIVSTSSPFCHAQAVPRAPKAFITQSARSVTEHVRTYPLPASLHAPPILIGVAP
jgi:hypothetical protein